MDVEASFNQRLQLVEQVVEELQKGQSDIQQSLVDLTNFFTQFHAQPLEEAIQPPRNPIANQEGPRNQPIHIHDNQLYGNNLPGYLLEDSDFSD